MTLKQRDFLTVWDFSSEELLYVLNISRQIKAKFKEGGRGEPSLAGKCVALLFQKPSTRTRLSFEVGIRHLGAHPIYLNWSDLQVSRGESISDTAKVLGRYVDCIVARVRNHADLEEMARSADVPVINALSDLHHPCQALADYLTLWEKLGRLKGINLTFIGDGASNVCTSLLQGAARLGVNMTVCSPTPYLPSRELVEQARREALETGSSIVLETSPSNAVRNADAIYTDVWVSMGKEHEADVRLSMFPPYQVNSELLSNAPSHAIVMHCLPAKRGLEITDDVIDSERSVVWDQAENKLHVQKGLLISILS